ncbi:hypothetical protein BaRGS_00020402 [Batillaria attramentaria]|uniref:Replication-associated protein n=1 Tax=Batillaria attramentaria TaxID=370345 RepID=A0ABD0KNF4_9CAEN
MPGAKRWQFTLYDYTAEHELTLRGLQCRYLICSPQTSPASLKGYVQFSTRKTKVRVHALISGDSENIRLDVEVARGSAEDHKKHLKHGEYFEIGTAIRQGERTDILRLYDDMKGNKEPEELIQQYGNTYVQNKRKLEEIIEHQVQTQLKRRRKEEFHNCTLRDWQQEVVDKLENQDDRKILFVVDEIGNQGKSWLADYICTFKNALYTNSTKYSDVMHAFKNEEIVVFDLCRQQVSAMNYGTLEAFKNGRGFSGKYASMSKIYDKCKVVVFMNSAPDESKLSADRLDIYRPRQEMSKPDVVPNHPQGGDVTPEEVGKCEI